MSRGKVNIDRGKVNIRVIPFFSSSSLSLGNRDSALPIPEDALDKFLRPLNIIDLDRSAAVEAAAIRAQLEKKGISIEPYDLLIAGLARSRDMTLVTNNTKEFERVVDLHLEDWITPQ